MNIFVIPSWYPSTDYPLTGIMIYEQTKALCSMYNDISVGVSIWGQQEENYLLWSKDHFKNLLKIAQADFKPFNKDILHNLKEYHKPTLSWTNKVANGNMRAIVKANLFNFRAFEKDFGKVDLIHAQVNRPAGLIAKAIAEKTKTPFCITERMSPFPCSFSSDRKGKLKKDWLAPYTFSSINITISPAQALLMQKQGIPNIKVIPNFIDEDFFKSSLQKIKLENFIFLTLTSGIPRKGIDILLQAISLLKCKQPNLNVTFRIGGIGNMDTYKAFSKTLGIESHIVWLKQADRKEALQEFQQCHAFVLPSLEESFGNVYAEAIACGKPVVATKCGGPESIVNSINGLLVEKNDVIGLAAAIQQIINNYNLYNSELIRQDFINRFSKKTVIPQIVKLYQKIILK